VNFLKVTPSVARLQHFPFSRLGEPKALDVARRVQTASFRLEPIHQIRILVLSGMIVGSQNEKKTFFRLWRAWRDSNPSCWCICGDRQIRRDHHLQADNLGTGKSKRGEKNRKGLRGRVESQSSSNDATQYD